MKVRNIAVVGTGMSALGSILALVEAGIKPTVIDAGSLRDVEIPIKFSHLRSKPPGEWLGSDRASMINTIQLPVRGLPRKLSFGSSDAYGSEAQLYRGDRIPPYSHFFGGLTQVWGGSALVTPAEEFRDWPIQPDQMAPYFLKALSALPYAANSDNLDKHFGKPKMNTGLSISAKDRKYLSKLERNLQGNIFVGQSRLLVHSSGDNGCKYCGFCMTGCAYSSIFKSSELIIKLVNSGKINLIENHVLHRVSEIDGVVLLDLQNKAEGKIVCREFEKVYLGAGAAETTRIVLDSVKSFESAKLHGRGSCIVPLMSFTTKATEWPSVFTLPSIFIEFLDRKVGSWTHIQMTNQNELVFKAIGFLKQGRIQKWQSYIAANLSTLMINDNSQYGVVYTLKRSKGKHGNVSVSLSTEGSKLRFLVKAFKCSTKIAFSLGIVPLIPLARMNMQTYHLGGSFPMASNRTKVNETDILGRLSGFKNLHIVDSSTYPSIPSTTLAILLTANAWRITDGSL
jgi:hypothetical protein